MTYAYGMKGAPTVGNGLGGLPKREIATSEFSISSDSAFIYPRFKEIGDWTEFLAWSDVSSNVSTPLSFNKDIFFIVTASNGSKKYLIDTENLPNYISETVTLIGSPVTDKNYVIYRSDNSAFSGSGQYVQQTGDAELTYGVISGYTGNFCGINKFNDVIYIITSAGLYTVNLDFSVSLIVLYSTHSYFDSILTIAKIEKTTDGYVIAFAVGVNTTVIASQVITLDYNFNIISAPAMVTVTIATSGTIKCNIYIDDTDVIVVGGNEYLGAVFYLLNDGVATVNANIAFAHGFGDDNITASMIGYAPDAMAGNAIDYIRAGYGTGAYRPYYGCIYKTKQLFLYNSMYRTDDPIQSLSIATIPAYPVLWDRSDGGESNYTLVKVNDYLFVATTKDYDNLHVKFLPVKVWKTI